MPPKGRPEVQRTQEETDNEARDQISPIQQLVDLLVGALQNRNPNNEMNLNLPALHVANFKDFKSVGPPEFKGTIEPIEVQSWIEEIENAFVIARVREEQKTIFATYMMKGEANFWWEANQHRAGEGVVLWGKFKELFFKNYFPRSMQSRMEPRSMQSRIEMRFLVLKQGDMSVLQYASKFNKLAKFASHQVDTEERKARRFE